MSHVMTNAYRPCWTDLAQYLIISNVNETVNLADCPIYA